MKKRCSPWVLLLVLFASQAGFAGKNSIDDPYIQSELQTILSGLSDNLNRFEHLQQKLQSSVKDNESYNEHKNIWLSTILAISAISSICEYENDLLVLFMDLRKSRRAHYFDVRIKSLDNSIQEITVMADQIRINHQLMPPDLAELHLFDRLKKNIDATINLLKDSKDLLIQLKTN
ncbi:MAG: hypothetical protein ISR63_08220 [Desulfobacterales bacterium]|nr:hypothetical protein [Desulfobacterales bacterium]